MAEYAGEEIICIVTGAPGSTLHHLTTRGAGGTDDEWNLLPVCQLIHQMIHNKGLAYCAKKFPAIRDFLIQHDWEYDDFNKKWRHLNDHEESK